MRNLQKPLAYRGWNIIWQWVVLAAVGVLPWAALAAPPANDNFVNALDITTNNHGLFGSITNDLTAATAEAGEPSHAGQIPTKTVWFKWTAPKNGEVLLDTLSSSLDTVLAVYTGSQVTQLRQVAANDDLAPFAQFNYQFNDESGFTTQPRGPSALRFNATVDNTYYFVVGTKFGPGGPVVLGWAYNPSGVFRFATEDMGTLTFFNSNSPAPVTRTINVPMIKTSASESSAAEDSSTLQTYYKYSVPGVVVAVSRIAGSVGRMSVQYYTETTPYPLVGLPLMAGTNADDSLGSDKAPIGTDAPATNRLHFNGPTSTNLGTLVFDDFEMTKRIYVPIIGNLGRQLARAFDIVLTNAQLDAAESPDIIPAPRIDGTYGRVTVRILNPNMDPEVQANYLPDTMPDPNDPTNVVGIVKLSGATNAVVSFTRAAYRAPEDVTNYWGDLIITAHRSGRSDVGISVNYRNDNILGGGNAANPGEGDNNIFPLQPGSDYATPLPTDDDRSLTPGIGYHGSNADYYVIGNYSYPGGGTLSWGANDGQDKEIHLKVADDQFTEFNEDFHLYMYFQGDRNGFDGVHLVGMIDEAAVTILFDDRDPPAGSVDQFHNPDFGARMSPPVSTSGDANRTRPGADGAVYGLTVQSDNKTVIVGDFQHYNSTTRNRIARMNLDGSLDTSFNPGGGANDFINAIGRTSVGQFYIVGGFTSYNGTPRPEVARLNSNGSLDTGFNPVAPDGLVWSLAVQPDGKVIIVGDFTSVGGVARAHIARLNTNGLLDATFDPGPNGPDGLIWSVALQSNGKVVIGGEFGTVGGFAAGGIARLNDDGTRDGSFDPGAGTDGAVYALAVQSDGRILVGGSFSKINFNPRNNLTRLNSDGSLDQNFDPGSIGSDAPIQCIVADSAGIYLGGSFTSYNGTHRMGYARLYYNGTVDTTFLDTAYNQFAGLHRARFSDAPGVVYTTGIQSDGNPMIGGIFKQVGGGQNDDKDIRSEVSTNAFLVLEPKSRDGVRNRNNVARLLGGATPGPGNIGLVASSTSVNENQDSVSLSLVRTNGYLGYLSANFQLDDGLAVSGKDYVYNAAPPIYLSSWNIAYPASEPGSDSRMHSDGLYQDNFVPTSIYGQTFNNYTPGNLIVSFIDDTLNQGDRNTTYHLSNPTAADVFTLGGENIPLGGALGMSQAALTIVDDDKKPGVLLFASAEYVVNENVTNAVITVIRTNGSYGTISCQFTTLTNGSTATVGSDYAATNGVLTFGPSVTNRSFSIHIVDDSVVEGDELIKLQLTPPNGSILGGITNAFVRIVDNDTPGGKLNFTSATYNTNESGVAAAITVTRSGSSSGTLTVQVAATNGTAIAGQNFTAITNLISWSDGDTTSRTVYVPILDDVQINPDRTVNLRLLNPTLNSNPDSQALGTIANAVLTIANDDFSGQVGFSTTFYRANENGGSILIPVVRTGGSAESITVSFAAIGFTASPSDFVPTNGTLTFGPGELVKNFAVVIKNNIAPDAARAITLALSNASPVSALGFPVSALINIIDDETYNEPPGGLDTQFNPIGMDEAVLALGRQDDGQIIAGGDFTSVNQVTKNRLVRLNAAPDPNPSDGSLDPTFNASANGSVRVILCQQSEVQQHTLIAGSFTAINGVARNHIARLNPNGSLDSILNPGAGTDGPVFTLAQTFNGTNRLTYVGGSFTTYNTIARNGIARIADNGSLDTSFNPGSGANGIVYSVGVYPTNTTHAGQVVVAGDFTTMNNAGYGRIVRLNKDGSIDPSFNPGAGANAAIRALVIQPDGRILIAGSFTNYNGTSINRFARLKENGSLDETFTPGAGADDTVSSITLQGDTKIVLGGDFTRCNGVTRNHLTRINNDGTVDPTINFGAGADNFVAATLVQSDDGKIVIGGGFTSYDGTPRQRIARIYGGSVSGEGKLEFTAANYDVSESGTNVTVTVRRRGGTSGLPDVSVDVVTADFTATNGVNYQGGTFTVHFPPGEVFQNVQIPVINDNEVNPPRIINLSLQNLLPQGVQDAPELGNQPIATVTIVNDDSAVSFETASYTVSENAPGGVAAIRVVRVGSIEGTASVDFLTTTNGTATPTNDFTMVTNTLVFNPGESVKTVFIPIINDNFIEGDETVSLLLSNVSGAYLLEPSTASLTIVDDDFAPGVISFAATNYYVGENGGNAEILLTRTNGRSGQVSVHYVTTDVSATSGLDYVGGSGTVKFDDGETNKSIFIPINNDTSVEGPEVFNVTISNPSGGATIAGTNTAPVTILDDDLGITLSSPFYVVGEAGNSVTITVLRLNGSNGVATVNYTTTNITATAGEDYTATSGTLVFTNGEYIKSFNVPILQDAVVEGDETFGVLLSNPTPGIQLLGANSTVTILDDDTGLSFGPVNYTVAEGGTNVILTIVRSNANTIQPVTVTYGTTNGTATAGSDYAGTAGVLTFTNGEAFKTITVPILQDQLVEGDESFTVVLSNPTGGAQFTGPSVATVTIVDDDAGVAFSNDHYTISEGGVQQTVTVLRTGITNSTVAVSYATRDGTASNGLDYVSVSGMLVFTNGETVKTFTVPIIDDTIVEGSETVLLQLSSPTGQVALLPPSASILTIVDNDGSQFQTAGALLLSESVAVNGAVDTNETVTALFAIRNVSPDLLTTSNLVATLLSTNGVIPTNTAPQNYGSLTSGGASASRPFTFKANGTNGAIISAVFQLKDDFSTNLGQVSFNFLLGSSSATFSNLSAITINDPTNSTPAPATPYPSVINVGGLGGSVSKIAVTLTNLAHTSPADIDMLLSGPGGQRVLMFSDVGGGNQITNVTITLDDSAAFGLPTNATITNGTYKPTNFLLGDSFPQPAPPTPFGSAFSDFIGSNPNGSWSLYVVDDTVLDTGSIARGWILQLTTSGIIPASSDLSVTLQGPLQTIQGSNYTFSITVTNHGPWTAHGIALTNLVPAGVSLLSVSPAAGVATNVAGQIVWTIGTLGMDASTNLTVQVRSTTVGMVTNISSAVLTEADPNAGNNTASLSTLVVAPTANLVLSVIDTPDPVYYGGNLTYSLFATNLGPATADSVSITNVLPPNMTFVSATPAGYVISGRVVTFTNLGGFGSNAVAMATVTVHPTAAGTFTNTATVVSTITDPFKSDNTAAIKTVVDFPPLSSSVVGNNLVISWPADATSYSLESATNLTPPVIWTPVNIPAGLNSGGFIYVTNNIGIGNQFFRLRAAVP